MRDFSMGYNSPGVCAGSSLPHGGHCKTAGSVFINHRWTISADVLGVGRRRERPVEGSAAGGSTQVAPPRASAGLAAWACGCPASMSKCADASQGKQKRAAPLGLPPKLPGYGGMMDTHPHIPWCWRARGSSNH